MGWHGDRIGHGSNQWKWLGHGDRLSFWNKFNSDDHNDESEHCRRRCIGHGDIACCSIDSNIWGYDINGYWFHGADHEL